MFVSPQLAPRDPRFVHQPSELCMLATKWDGTVPSGGLIVQEKVDGIRALWFDGSLWTREGMPIEGVGHIIAGLRAIERRAGEALFLDGEFQVDGTLPATIRHFRAAGERGDAGRLFLFDVVPLAEWRANGCALPLSARLSRLDGLVSAAQGAAVERLPWSLCASSAALQAHAAAAWANSGEGSVGKVAGSLYRRHRSALWAKVKRQRSASTVDDQQ